MEQNKALKHLLYARKEVESFAVSFETSWTHFDRQKFLDSVYDDSWDQLELKQRMRHITLALKERLPSDYAKAIQIMRDASTGMKGWITLSLCDYVALFGLENWEISLSALEHFTPLCSAEFAIRPFLQKDLPRTLTTMKKWAKHANDHVRRLSTEGCRPRLPWGEALPALKKDPEPILPIMKTLRSDPSEYVRNSVANNLNDICKDNPEVVLKLLREWQKEDLVHFAWITERALRTLVKQGNPEALELLGFGESHISVEFKGFSPSEVSIGEKIQFRYEITSLSKKPQKLLIDYLIHYLRDGDKHNKKVFKISKREIKPFETIIISKTQSFEPISTRRFYPGRHFVELQVNGKRYKRQPFLLVDAS